MLIVTPYATNNGLYEIMKLKYPQILNIMIMRQKSKWYANLAKFVDDI